METDLLVTTFPALTEFQRASSVQNAIGAACGRIDPTPALSLVAVPALVMSREERAALESAAPDITFSGWVDYQIATGTNCGRCGMPTCLALAMHVWTGEASARRCLPVFEEGEKFSHLQEPLLEICAGMGIAGVDQG